MITYLPNDIEIEDTVLGAAIVDQKDNKGLEKLLSIMKPDYFYSPESKIIFNSIRDLSNENKPVDFMTLQDRLGKNYSLKLMQITSRVSSSANIEYHCAILIQKYTARQVLLECSHAIQKIYEKDSDVFGVRSNLLLSLEGMNVRTSREPVHISKSMEETLETIRKVQSSEQKVVGVDTGYRDLNFLFHGWQPSDLVIIAARPSTGKTAFALNIAYKVARQGISVGFFSMEMSLRQVSERLLANQSDVYLNYIRKAELSETHWKFIDAEKYDYPLYVDDSGNLTIFELKEKVRLLKRKHDIKILIVDYLQLMEGDKSQNRTNEVGSISRALKGIAKELQITVIALAQLNREVEKRKGPPIMSDLRESGDIEQDADIIGFLHCEKLYNVNLLGQREEIPEPIIDFIVAKHRNGEVKTLEFRFDKGHQRFKDI